MERGYNTLGIWLSCNLQHECGYIHIMYLIFTRQFATIDIHELNYYYHHYHYQSSTTDDLDIIIIIIILEFSPNEWVKNLIGVYDYFSKIRT